MKIRTSEVFWSFQGEGRYTGVPAVWVRLFGCNLECKGFGQVSPELPDTYVIRPIDVSKYEKMEDLPVMEYGCDSAYSVSHLYKHLATDYTEETLADKIEEIMPYGFNRSGDKIHLPAVASPHLCITGGEPMLQQKAIIALIKELIDRGNYPHEIQIETNGTVPLTDEFKKFKKNVLDDLFIKLYFNISPKLLFVSGETSAINLEVLGDYANFATTADFKFVMSKRDEAWLELHTAVRNLTEDSRVFYGIAKGTTRFYVMPMGASKEQQEHSDVKDITIRALSEGYYISGRLHCYIFGNAMAT